MKTFTTYAEKKAKQFFNLLQGYTKGIRITAILILLLIGVSNAWADQYLNAVWMKYTFNGNEGTCEYFKEDNNKAAVSLGTLTSDFIITDCYWKCWTNWTPNTTTGYLWYQIGNQTAVTKTQSVYNIGNKDYEVGGSSLGWKIASYTDPSGIHTMQHNFDMRFFWGNSNEYNNYAMNNWGHNYKYQYTILPPNVKEGNNFIVTASNCISGTGTSADPFVIKNGSTTVFNVTANKTHSDANSKLKVSFNNGSNWSTGTNATTTSIKSSEYTPSQSKKNITIQVKHSNGTLDCKTVSSRTIYYIEQVAETTHTITIINNINSEESTKTVGETTPVEITAPNIDGYTFTTWKEMPAVVTITSGSLTDKTIYIKAKEDATLTALYEKDPIIHFSREGEGSITVLVNGSPINSGSSHVKGTEIKFTATASEGSEFTKWVDGNGNQLSTANPYNFTLNADATVKAIFSKKRHTITFNAGLGGSVSAKVGENSINSGATLDYGTQIVLTATPDRNNAFSKWIDGNGTQLSTNATYTHTLKGDITINAVFITPTTVYLKPSNDWKADYARFAIYWWKGNNNGWVEMTADCNSTTTYYYGEIPVGVSNFQFVRLNPDGKGNATKNDGLHFDFAWNQTGNLTILNGKYLYDLTQSPKKHMYLKPNANWLTTFDNGKTARYAAYFFGGSSGEQWVSMSIEDATYHVYKCEIPSGDYPKVIFCRMNPDNPTNNWDDDKRWTQTEDLNIQDGKNLFTIADAAGTDKNNKANGAWSTWWDNCYWSNSTPTYTVTYTQPTGGTISVTAADGRNITSGSSVALNSKIKISIRPNAGNQLTSSSITIGTDDSPTADANGYYTVCGATKISAEFIMFTPNTISVTAYKRVYNNEIIDYGWVDGDGNENTPYIVYTDEAVRIVVSQLEEIEGLTAYYKFGSTEQTSNVFDWKNISTEDVSSMQIKAYYRDDRKNKSTEVSVQTAYFKAIQQPFYLMTDPANEVSIDQIKGKTINVQFRSDYAGEVKLYLNSTDNSPLATIPQTTSYDYRYDVLNDVKPQVLRFIAKSSAPLHGRLFEVDVEISLYKHVTIKVKDPEGWANKVYLWRGNDSGEADVKTEWPGENFLQHFGTWRVFTVKYPYYDHFIVNTGSSEKQTENYPIPDHDVCYELSATKNGPNGKYTLTETDCPDNLIVNGIKDSYEVIKGEEIVIVPSITLGLGFNSGNIKTTISTTGSYATATKQGTNLLISGNTVGGPQQFTVTYQLQDETPISFTFNVTVVSDNKITIQVKVPTTFDGDGNEYLWKNTNKVYVRYWWGDFTGDVNMTHVATQDNFYRLQARVPLGNTGKINFHIYYEYIDSNNHWRQTDNVTEVNDDGCYTLHRNGMQDHFNRGITHDGDNCWDENAYAYYQVKIYMGSGKTYTSNIVTQTSETLSFFAPGMNEENYRAGTVYLYRNNNMHATIPASKFPTSNVYTARINSTHDGLDAITPYSGSYYIRTDGATGGWTNYLQNGNKMTSFESREEEFYNHYWVESVDTEWKDDNPVGKKRRRNVSACVANEYNDDLAGKLEADKLSDENGYIYLDERTYSEYDRANVRFGYDPRTNYFGRAVLRGSLSENDQHNFLNAYCENAYTTSAHTTRMNSSLANSQFLDMSNWVYQKEFYVMIDNTHPSASLYIESTAFNNTKNHLLGYVKNEIGEDTDEPIKRTIMGSGTTNNIYHFIVVYDFKTNRLIEAWMPEGTVTINSEVTINSNILFLRKENDEVPQIQLDNTKTTTGQIDSLKSVYFAMEFERGDEDASKRHQEQYWFTLPFDCTVRSISGVPGYMQIWGIQRYRGDLRAENGWFNPSTTFWEWLTLDDVMHAGEGYLLVFDKKNAPFRDVEVDILDDAGNKTGNKKKIAIMRLYFPSKTSGFDMQQQSEEQLTRTYENHTCTITTANRDLQDSNWKVIGTTSYNNAGISGYTKDSDPEYEELSDAPSFRYQYEYTMSNDNKTFWYKYTPENGQTATYKSFYGYMVQFAGTINWQPIMSETVPDHIAARRYVPANERTSYTTRLELANAAGEVQDLTFVALDEKATTGFDQNKDLNKVLNRGTNIYTFVEGLPFAGNTLPMEKATVPVGVRVNAAGEYTFRMPDGTDGIAVTLVDNATGTHTNMLMSEYTVTLDAGTIENRFYLVVDPDRTATSVENVGEEAKGEEAKGQIKKFLIDGKLFIRTADGIFDAKGQRL